MGFTRSQWCLTVLLFAGCAKPQTPANPAFSDALVYAFRTFDGDEADLAFAIRQLEQQVYLSMDVDTNSVHDRALAPEPLSEEDISALEHPDRDPNSALPVAVAGSSPFGVDDHKHIQLLTDHVPVEPYSPNQYDRTFIEGEDCWLERECAVLKTHQDLVKENLLMTIPYSFFKDFRWIDLNLPDPASELSEDAEPLPPRWAIVSRSWLPERAEGETGKNSIEQSFTLELWVPRDGQGFLQADVEDLPPEVEWTSDSSGGGVLRLLSLWSETELEGLNVSDDVVASTTRAGIEKNFKAADDWIEERAN